MIDGNFEFISTLQYRVKNLTGQVREFKSGEKYVKMRSEHKMQLTEKDRELQRLRQELAAANSMIVTVRENWLDVIEDIEKEHKKELRGRDQLIDALQKQLWGTEDALAETREKLRDKNKELYAALTELEEERGKNLKLKAQIDRDHESSSIPSSMKPNRKKIENNREKTGRNSGGQPGHEGHGRKRQIPTNTIEIPPPEKYADSTLFKPTGKTITKQMVNISVVLAVDEYVTPEYRNLMTGQRVHADFPEGVVNDVNYGGSIKAFAFLLNNHCNVSIAKTSDLISELTDGKLRISAGMINGLSKEFSAKTEAQRKSVFSDLLLSPVMGTDFTSVRLNGKNVQVIVCATSEKAQYFAREHKGHEGVKGTPVEDYQGILVHDHDKTFYNYGDGHQECLTHPLRYLKDSMINEPCLEWNRQMRALLQQAIHFRNGLNPEDAGNPDEIDPDIVKKLRNSYLRILALAKEEYEDEPPSDYYRDGYNLYKKLHDYMENHLLFLHDKRVPTSNNLCERLLRILKRKMKQCMTFRSFDSIVYLCDCLGIIALIRARENNLYTNVAAIFG